ncbi:MAG: hypothetical protein MJY91_01275 [Bacteroidales bacterium]|nr:hypothetical protein [Candidatus Cryptobacteroides choladohippi]MCQ2178719.1 hypothetical protein [Bacteroidales bacterium]
MTAHYESKHGQVLRRKEELFMAFTDMRNFTRMMPEQAQSQVSLDADFDNLWATVQNFKIGVRIDERVPYSTIRLVSTNSPVEFVGALHFDESALPGRTDFHVVLDANLNMVMRAMLGKKIQEALDKLVQGLVDVSEGKMPDIPEGMI